MVMINEAWAELIGNSSPKLNAMTIVAYSGTEISALSSTAVDGQVVYCHTSGSNYIRGHWYGWDAVLNGGSWVDLVELPSTYNFFADTKIADAGMVIDRRSATKEMYYNNASGTGAAVSNVMTDNSLQYINLDTGTTSTGHAELYAGGPNLDFGKSALLKVKFKTSTGAVTGQINKLGVNIDLAGTGPATRRNFGIEWCDGDTDFQIHSGDGTSQSNFDTNIPVTTDSTWEASIFFEPGSKVRVIFDDGTTATEKEKSTFIPSSGISTEDGIMKLSISNNAGNTTSRNLKIRAAYLVYNVADGFWS